MRADEVRARTDNELRQELQTAYRDLVNLRFRWHTRQLANVYEIKKIRKNIARIRTVLTERALEMR